MPNVNSFDVLKTMGERNMDIRLAPLSNIIRAKVTKKGTEVTIGVPGDVCNGILALRFVGGLILADKEQFDKVKAELEKGVAA